jgi:hypothetical protein
MGQPKAKANGEEIGFGRSAYVPAPGWRVLIPGLSQIHWGQVDRGEILLGMFTFAFGASLFAWGTWQGWVFLAFAYLSHVSATLDVIRQGSFPIYPRWTSWISTSGVLGVGVYAPLVTAMSLLAWPGFCEDSPEHGYLVNRHAFREHAPSRGDWVWVLATSPRKKHFAAQVVATAGQEVEWNGKQWLIDGADASLRVSPCLYAPPERIKFRVPADQILLDVEIYSEHQTNPAALQLVSTDQVVGRAWARYYPIRERRLL